MMFSLWTLLQTSFEALLCLDIAPIYNLQNVCTGLSQGYSCFFPLILDIDDCASVPCKNNATCIDGIDEFSCNCSPGYYGDNCTESKDHILIYHHIHVTIVCGKKVILKMFHNLG